MILSTRITGFLSLAGAAWSLFAGGAHFDALLLSGTFLLGSSMIAEGRRQPKALSATLEIGARLAALGAEHEGLAARMKTLEVGVKQATEERTHKMIDGGAAMTRPVQVVDAVTSAARDNVIRLFADTQRGTPK